MSNQVKVYLHCSSCGGGLEGLLHGDGIYVDTCEKCTGKKGTLAQVEEEIKGLMSRKRSLFIVMHKHRHGTDVYPVFAEKEEDVNAEAIVGDNLESDREDEELEVRGPWRMEEIPAPGK